MSHKQKAARRPAFGFFFLADLGSSFWQIWSFEFLAGRVAGLVSCDTLGLVAKSIKGLIKGIPHLRKCAAVVVVVVVVVCVVPLSTCSRARLNLFEPHIANE